MINITRWLRTIHTLDLLPPPPVALLFETFTRDSPYCTVCEASATLRAACKNTGQPPAQTPSLALSAGLHGFEGEKVTMQLHC